MFILTNLNIMEILIMNDRFCLSVCLSETPLTQATLALHRHTVPCWKQNDPRIETLSFSFWAGGPFSPLQLKRMWAIQLWAGRGEVQVLSCQLLIDADHSTVSREREVQVLSCQLLIDADHSTVSREGEVQVQASQLLIDADHSTVSREGEVQVQARQL